MREIRTDPLTGDIVAISTDRVARPRHLRPGRLLDDDPAHCAFCPGNEAHTPRALATVDGPHGWRARAFPNRFPAVGIEGELDPRAVGPYDVTGGIGAHEVIVETRRHDVGSWRDPVEQAAALRLARDRMRDLARDGRFRSVLWFRNHGPEAGASLGHPHAQIVALPTVPPRLRRVATRCRRHLDAHDRELWKDILDLELRDRRRLLVETDTLVAWCHFAPSVSFETLIAPRRPLPSFLDCDDRLISEVAEVMSRVMVAIDDVLAGPPHNTLLVTAPIGGSPGFRWHLRITPRLAAFAGFELLSGGTMIGTAPEEAARLLRERL
jgi:UDPglucose--hexose-1-phosphate uridylyltransferase